MYSRAAAGRTWPAGKRATQPGTGYVHWPALCLKNALRALGNSPPFKGGVISLQLSVWPVDRACSRLGSPFSRLAMFSRLLPGCLTPTCRQRRHNYICQATCPGCPLFPGCPAAQCSLFSRLPLSRLFTRHFNWASCGSSTRSDHGKVGSWLGARMVRFLFDVGERLAYY